MSSPQPDSSSEQKQPLSTNEATGDEVILEKGGNGNFDERPDPPFLENHHRCIIFFIFEAAFLAFAAFLQAKHIPLPDRSPHFPDFISQSFLAQKFISQRDTSESFATTLIKGGITIALNAWHGIAVAIASSILADAFSREWKFRQNKAAADKPKPPIDSVSVISSGILDQMRYIISSRNPSKPFLTAFIASVWMITLSTAGPSAVVVVKGIVTRPITVGGLILGSSAMTSTILKAEQTFGLKMGYDTEPNWIIPKPAANASRDFDGDIVYISDIISFNHTCEWHKPIFADPTLGGNVDIGGQSFDFSSFSPPPATTTQGRSTITSGTGVFHVLPSNAVGTSSAFLIFGGNSSLPLNNDPIFTGTPPSLDVIQWRRARGNSIDLSHIETAYEPRWYNFSSGRYVKPTGDTLVFRAPLAAGLLCDSHSALMTGKVRLTSNNLTVLSWNLGTGGTNIKKTDIPNYFSQALEPVGAIQDSILIPSPDSLSGGLVLLLVDFSPLAQRLLLSGSVSDGGSGGQLSVDSSTAPLPLAQIAQNMNAFMLSASKAQSVDGSRGFTADDVPTDGSGLSQTLDATGPGLNFVLSSNPLWFGVTVLLILITCALCLYVTLLVRKEERDYPPFTLHYVESHAKQRSVE